MTNRARYELAIRRKVCEHCIDLKENHQCALSEEDICSIRAYLDQIIEAVRSVKSQNMADYIEALRKKICEPCKHQKKDGSCELRDSRDCALDRYFELIIEAIEEVQNKLS